MGPKKNFKKFDPTDFEPKQPANSFISQQYKGGHQFNPGSSTFVPGQGISPSGYSSGTQTPISGTSSPAPSAPASTLSLSSLSSALKDVEATVASEHFEAVLHAKQLSDARSAASRIADIMYDDGAIKIERYYVFEHVKSLCKVKNALVREGGALILGTIARKFGPNTKAEAYLLQCFQILLDLMSDKEPSVKRAAQAALDSMFAIYPDEAKASAVLTKLLEYLDSSAKWQGKVACLKLVEKIVESVPQDFLDERFIDTIPVLTEAMHDFKPELSKAAEKTLTIFAGNLDNQDVTPRVDVIVNTLSDPKQVENCIKTLAKVTFVTEVTEPTLAILVPIMNRALNLSSSTQDILRQTTIIVENLTRLVHDPREVKPFIPQLLPGVKKVVETAAQPEVRELAGKALKVLEDAQYEHNDTKKKITYAEAEAECESENIDFTLKQYAADLIKVDVNTREFKRLDQVYKVYLDVEGSDRVEHFKQMFADVIKEDDGEEGIEIVNAQFSLAYGGRMLLNKATLRLFKGHRYGLCGRNGAGKSTLMRSIAEGKLEGFPDKSELKTCFVEHKLQGSEADMDIVSFIAGDPDLQVDRSEITAALKDVGFDEERQRQQVGALSGGWKMKLELARAVLMKADILLLDEPTNHLDVGNVKWLQDYLITHTDITSLIVSHDSGFLDAVCTDIIHYESKKLVYYKGNLSEFVKVRPEGKAYYTLTDSNMKMAFPPPGLLSGVKSATRAIARMTDVTFTYPGAEKPSLSNVSCTLSLSSRVAILGPNGAGKSTLIKLLTGEMISDSGKVDKHPNLRIGYIAQHALQHVELHKEKTPNQYLQWRYHHGDDREVLLKQTRQWSEAERKQMETPIDPGDGRGPRQVEAIIGRQKLKKSYQYEIKWKHWLPKYNSHLSKEFLMDRGFYKMIQKYDDYEASREGLSFRHLEPKVIRQHFEDVGLDGDIADHTPLGSLSGGQLVKVVIAGAMWNNPHLLVLDEPTNYLDRDSLGGLAVAIREWGGGVVMISHNNEFVGALCPEQWHVEGGKVVQRGKNAVNAGSFEESAPTTPGEMSSNTSTAANSENDDSPSNVKVRRKKKKLTRNQLKEREARRRLRYIEWLNTPKGTPRPADTDDEDE